MILDYIEMPLRSFLVFNPEYTPLFPFSKYPDPRYLVRIQLLTGTMEVGFAEDDWQIK